MGRDQHILVVSEFNGGAFDGLVSSACTEITRKLHVRVVLTAGFLRRYHYGGLRPSRLLNYAVVYIRSLGHLIWHRPIAVLVDTTPPLIHLWMALIGRLVRVKVYVWMMDYHPEIEARALEGIKGLRWLAGVLRYADRTLLGGVSGVVTLDEAMAETVRSQCSGLDVKVHPPWSKQGEGAYEPVALNCSRADFRIAYVGNLGAAHGLDDLEGLLAGMDTRRLHLLIVGGNVTGLRRWQEMAERLKARVEHADRLPWDDLCKRVDSFHPNCALVLMDESKAGLLSPSKYASYIRLGLPILYLGPRGTNADRLCRVIGAGVAATHDEIAQDRAAVVRSLLDPAAQDRRRIATEVAHEATAKLNEGSFVDLVKPWLTPATKV